MSVLSTPACRHGRRGVIHDNEDNLVTGSYSNDRLTVDLYYWQEGRKTAKIFAAQLEIHAM